MVTEMKAQTTQEQMGMLDMALDDIIELDKKEKDAKRNTTNRKGSAQNRKETALGVKKKIAKNRTQTGLGRAPQGAAGKSGARTLGGGAAKAPARNQKQVRKQGGGNVAGNGRRSGQLQFKPNNTNTNTSVKRNLSRPVQQPVQTGRRPGAQQRASAQAGGQVGQHRGNMGGQQNRRGVQNNRMRQGGGNLHASQNAGIQKHRKGHVKQRRGGANALAHTSRLSERFKQYSGTQQTTRRVYQNNRRGGNGRNGYEQGMRMDNLQIVVSRNSHGMLERSW